MPRPTRGLAVLATALLAASSLAAPRGQSPHAYAITGARVVTGTGDVIEAATVVIRGGRIVRVSAGEAGAPPPDAAPIDGDGLTVYPGLIDLGRSGLAEAPAIPAPERPESREQVERWKRDTLLRPQLDVSAHLIADDDAADELAAAGITTALAVPGGDGVRGTSALVHVVAPAVAPQVGRLAVDLEAGRVLRAAAMLHVSIPQRPPGRAYPQSLIGMIAFVRQAFLDAQYHGRLRARFATRPSTTPRPAHDAALDAMQPAVDGSMRVAFHARTAREIRRALALAEELALEPVIVGGLEADHVADDLAAANVPVILELNVPERPASLAPDAEEPLRVLRQRADAPGVAAALAAAGVRFGFSSEGLDGGDAFVAHVRSAVDAGLAPDRAIAALTSAAAAIAGAGELVGSGEAGKIADLVVTRGDLLDESTTVEHVFVDGRPVHLELQVSDSPSDDGSRRAR